MDSIVYRIEWKGSGPFWFMKTREEIEKTCKKIARPGKRDAKWYPDDFLSCYISSAPGPYDYPAMDSYLSMSPDGTYKFGFNSIQCLITQLALYKEFYEKQFKGLFKTGFFKVRAYLVEYVAYHETETLFVARTTQLLEEASTWEEFQRL